MDDVARRCKRPIRALILEIQAAFVGVTREGGVIWREALRRDPFGSVSEKVATFSSDADKNWQDLVADPRWRPDPRFGGLNSLDPIGFRYYLPACMVRALLSPGEVDFANILSPYLSPSGMPAEWKRAKWTLFSPIQLVAVARFLHYMVATTERDARGFVDWFCESGWTYAYRTYWYKHDPDRGKMYEVRDEFSDEERRLISKIESTFAGVRLGEGIGFYEADSIDGGGFNRAFERARDEREEWRNLLVNPDFMVWVSRSQYSFMDAEGIRFALPAEMIRYLQVWDAEFPHWVLTPPSNPSTDEDLLPFLASLDAEQRTCIAQFVHLQMDVDSQWEQEGGTSEWRLAYEGYWHAFDSEVDGPSEA